MTFARCGVVFLAVCLLAGCGGTSEKAKRRSAVNAYFVRVDQAELGLLSKVGEIDNAFRSFSLRTTTQAELDALVLARTRIHDGLGRVKAIAPPADARRVHSSLVQLLTLEEATADDLVRSVQFIPMFAATGPPLAAASKGLGRDLASVKPPPQTAAGAGAQLFTAAGCGSCHTLAASGSNGKAGPNLDAPRPSKAAVAAQVQKGGPGMPAYGKALTAAQIGALATYVASAAGHPAAAPAAGASAKAPAAAPDVYTAYAAAFAHYRMAIEPVLVRLAGLTAPPELRPVLVAQRHALARSISLCREIEAALGKHNVAAANKAIQKLFEVAARVNSPEVVRQQAAAARAYNARLLAIAKLSAKVTRERAQLQKTLG